MSNHTNPFPPLPKSEMTRRVVPVQSRILTKKEYMEGLMLRRKMRGRWITDEAHCRGTSQPAYFWMHQS